MVAHGVSPIGNKKTGRNAKPRRDGIFPVGVSNGVE